MQNGCDSPARYSSAESFGDAEPHVQKKEPHLLAPFVARNDASLVLLKRCSTLGFYGNSNIRAVKLQAGCQGIHLMLHQT